MTILFIGRSTFDLGYICAHFPAEDSKLSSQASTMSAGGPALNAAIAASALGTSARLVSAVGKGLFADFVKSELKDHGVELFDLAGAQDAVLPVSSIIVVPDNGSRTVIDQQPRAYRPAAFEPDVLLEGIDIVMTDGQFAPVALDLLSRARGRSIPTVLDGGSWKPGTAELLHHVDYAIVSERFTLPGAVPAADRFAAIHHFGPQSVAITRGAAPIEWSDAEGRGRITPPGVNAVDTLGAGDIFHGAFCHYLAATLPFTAALERAAGIAALSMAPGPRSAVCVRRGGEAPVR